MEAEGTIEEAWTLNKMDLTRGGYCDLLIRRMLPIPNDLKLPLTPTPFTVRFGEDESLAKAAAKLFPLFDQRGILSSFNKEGSLAGPIESISMENDSEIMRRERIHAAHKGLETHCCKMETLMGVTHDLRLDLFYGLKGRDQFKKLYRRQPSVESMIRNLGDNLDIFNTIVDAMLSGDNVHTIIPEMGLVNWKSGVIPFHVLDTYHSIILAAVEHSHEQLIKESVFRKLRNLLRRVRPGGIDQAEMKALREAVWTENLNVISIIVQLEVDQTERIRSQEDEDDPFVRGIVSYALQYLRGKVPGFRQFLYESSKWPLAESSTNLPISMLIKTAICREVKNKGNVIPEGSSRGNIENKINAAIEERFCLNWQILLRLYKRRRQSTVYKITKLPEYGLAETEINEFLCSDTVLDAVDFSAKYGLSREEFVYSKSFMDFGLWNKNEVRDSGTNRPYVLRTFEDIRRFRCWLSLFHLVNAKLIVIETLVVDPPRNANEILSSLLTVRSVYERNFLSPIAERFYNGHLREPTFERLLVCECADTVEADVIRGIKDEIDAYCKVFPRLQTPPSCAWETTFVVFNSKLNPEGKVIFVSRAFKMTGQYSFEEHHDPDGKTPYNHEFPESLLENHGKDIKTIAELQSLVEFMDRLKELVNQKTVYGGMQTRHSFSPKILLVHHEFANTMRLQGFLCVNFDFAIKDLNMIENKTVKIAAMRANKENVFMEECRAAVRYFNDCTMEYLNVLAESTGFFVGSTHYIDEERYRELEVLVPNLLAVDPRNLHHAVIQQTRLRNFVYPITTDFLKDSSKATFSYKSAAILLASVLPGSNGLHARMLYRNILCSGASETLTIYDNTGAQVEMNGRATLDWVTEYVKQNGKAGLANILGMSQETAEVMLTYVRIPRASIQINSHLVSISTIAEWTRVATSLGLNDLNDLNLPGVVFDSVRENTLFDSLEKVTAIKHVVGSSVPIHDKYLQYLVERHVYEQVAYHQLCLNSMSFNLFARKHILDWKFLKEALSNHYYRGKVEALYTKILEYNGIGEGQSPRKFRPIDIRDVLHHCLQYFNYLKRKPNFKFIDSEIMTRFRATNQSIILGRDFLNRTVFKSSPYLMNLSRHGFPTDPYDSCGIATAATLPVFFVARDCDGFHIENEDKDVPPGGSVKLLPKKEESAQLPVRTPVGLVMLDATNSLTNHYIITGKLNAALYVMDTTPVPDVPHS